jgi:uncharacterized protein
MPERLRSAAGIQEDIVMSKTSAFRGSLALLALVLAACSTPPSAVPQTAAPQIAASPTPTPPMSLDEAKQIASQSASCMQAGTLQDTAVYNPNSNTWWIDLKAGQPNCHPACVVDVQTKTAEVNWRCTGAVVPTDTPQPGGQIANPASVNCTKQGGQLVIQKRGDGGEYGICLFEDNRQCEEWALLNGDCPLGGLKVTGYVTPAAQYCVITGGTYTVTGNSNTPEETGTCAFKNGKTCDAGDYYDGKCSLK